MYYGLKLADPVNYNGADPTSLISK